MNTLSFKSVSSQFSSKAKNIVTNVAVDLLASTHFIAQTVVDGCIKAEVKITGDNEEDVANNRHNVTRMTQKEIVDGYESILESLGL